MTTVSGVTAASTNTPTPHTGRKAQPVIDKLTKLTGIRKSKVTPSPNETTKTRTDYAKDDDVDPWLFDQPSSKNTNDNPWITPVKKKRSHVDVTTNEEADTRVKVSVHDTIKQRGDELTEETTTKTTPVKVEFKLNNVTTRFNARTALGKLLEQMRLVDRHTIMKSVKDDEEWTTAEELPVGADLGDHVVIRHENNPLQRNSITIYTTIKSAKTISEIKFNQTMYHYLSTNKIYLRPDRYKTEKTRSPGFFIKLHPRLIYKDTYKNKINHAVKNLTLDKTNDVVAQYLSFVDAKSDDIPLPEYHLHSTKRKFGPVTAEVLQVTCPEHAATFLKTVLCKLSEKKALPQGIFIPTGTQQILGPATMVSLLRQHNMFLATTTMIALEGIDEEVMWESSLSINSSTNGTLDQKLRHDFPGIQTIEKTNSTVTTGKWFVVINKKDESSFHDYIDESLPRIFSSIEVNGMMLNMTPPKRSGAMKSSEVVGSYASVLKGMVKPMAGISEKKYDSPQLRPRKRPTVAISNSAEASSDPPKDLWPTLPNQDQTTHVQRSKEGEYTVDATLQEQITDMKTQIQALTNTQQISQGPHNTLEEKFNSLQKEMETKMDTKMKELSIHMEEQVIHRVTNSINALTKTIEGRLEASMATILNKVTSQIDTTLRQRFPAGSQSSANIPTSPLTQQLEGLHNDLSPGSDVEMIGARDP